MTKLIYLPPLKYICPAAYYWCAEVCLQLVPLVGFIMCVQVLIQFVVIVAIGMIARFCNGWPVVFLIYFGDYSFGFCNPSLIPFLFLVIIQV